MSKTFNLFSRRRLAPFTDRTGRKGVSLMLWLELCIVGAFAQTNTGMNPQITKFPQVWVDVGLVDCSGFTSQPCESSPSTITFWPWSTETTVTFSHYWATADNTPTPSILYTSPPVSTIPTTTTDTTQPSKTFQLCVNPAPTEFQTNSLSDLCQFVANVPNNFVSLYPTNAAYMPSSLGYAVGIFWSVVVALKWGFKDIDKTETSKKPRITTYFRLAFGTLFSSLRTILAIIELARHPLKEIQFVSPMLWMDWLSLSGDFERAHPRLYRVTVGMMFVMYIFSFWLTVGYGQFGYGTRQYEVLDIASACIGLDVSWQTDPRRAKFVIVQVIMLIISTVAFRGSLVFMTVLRGGTGADLMHFKGNVAFVGIMASLALIAPSAYGIWATVNVNPSNYIILSSGSGSNICYGNYISSRLGYVDSYWRDLIMTMNILLGVNI